MKVAVITPYFREPLQLLLRCCRSVTTQTYDCTHFMVADGFPKQELDSYPIRHIVLPRAHGDNGNTPRAVGGMCAIAEGFEALAYLDADNWYDPHHVSTTIELAEQTEANIVFAKRRLWLADGTRCPFEDVDVAARTTADTSSFVLTGRGLALASHWGLMPSALSPICDRVMVAAARANALPATWAEKATVNYESRWPTHYHAMGREAPPDAHYTDWDRVEKGYDARMLTERLGFDPFHGVGPHRGKNKPSGVIAED